MLHTMDNIVKEKYNTCVQ